MDTEDQHGIASISFRQLELFAAVGQCGSIQRAATACRLSQPAATQALAQLQNRVGVTLLERGLTGTALTLLGQLFHQRVERIIAKATAAIADLQIADAKGVVRRLTPAQVRTLGAVLQTGSLESAARSAGLTRGAMRRSAEVLEKYVGVLFARTPRGTQLTREGHYFAQRICALRDEVSLGISELQSQHADAANTIIVGAAQAFGNRLITRVLSELSAENVNARITVLREGPVELIARLRAGEVDLVIGDVEDIGTDLLKERLVATPYYIFARPGHPLSRLQTITIQDLAGYDWVGGTPRSVREAARIRLFAGLAPPRTALAASEGAVVGHFVAGSNRLALMTEHESRCGGLALGKVPFPAIESGLGIDVIRRVDRVPSPLHGELVELLRAHLDLPARRPGRERRAA